MSQRKSFRKLRSRAGYEAGEFLNLKESSAANLAKVRSALLRQDHASERTVRPYRCSSSQTTALSVLQSGTTVVTISRRAARHFKWHGRMKGAYVEHRESRRLQAKATSKCVHTVCSCSPSKSRVPSIWRGCCNHGLFIFRLDTSGHADSGRRLCSIDVGWLWQRFSRSASGGPN